MKVLGLLSLGLLLSSVCLANPEKKEKDGFISLFNGKDLSHWETTGNWLPQQNGSLLIQPKPGQEGWQRYSDYLISKEKFGDFILTLEYKYPPPRETAGSSSALGIQKIRLKLELNARFWTHPAKRMIKWVTMTMVA